MPGRDESRELGPGCGGARCYQPPPRPGCMNKPSAMTAPRRTGLGYRRRPGVGSDEAPMAARSNESQEVIAGDRRQLLNLTRTGLTWRIAARCSA